MAGWFGSVRRRLGRVTPAPVEQHRIFPMFGNMGRLVVTIANTQRVTVQFGSCSYDIENRGGLVSVSKKTGRPVDTGLAEGSIFWSHKKKEKFRVGDLVVERAGNRFIIDYLPEEKPDPMLAPAPAAMPAWPTRSVPIADFWRKAVPDPVVTVPAGLDGQPTDQYNYRELSGQEAEQLRHGDVIVGRYFVLGQPETYDQGFVIVNISATSDFFPLLAKARAIAAAEDVSTKQIVEGIAQMLTRETSSEIRDRVVGQVETIGFMVKHGGVCVHRAVALQLCLQEAGIRSRIVKGKYGSEGHEWVEIDINEDGKYSYLVDLQFGHQGEIKNETELTGEGSDRYDLQYEVNGLKYLCMKKRAVIWRPLGPGMFPQTIVGRKIPG